MVELTREQIPQIRQMVEAIDQGIEELEARLNNKKTAARDPRKNSASNRITETGKRDPNRREVTLR
jgi:BMFP domain-containing protein YqiC